MWKSVFLLREATKNYPQANVEKKNVFNRLCGRKTKGQVFHSLSLHNPQNLCKKSETGINIGGNIPYAVLHGDITGF